MPNDIQQQKIPTFYLYGDEQSDEELDTLHVEPIHERSLRHDWIIHPHIHPDHTQILWISDGGGTFTIEGEALTASAMNLVVQPAGMVHEIRFQPGSQGRVVTAATSFLEAVAGDDPRLLEVARRPAVYSIEEGGPCRQTIPHAFQQLLDEARLDPPARRVAVRAHLLSILVALYRTSIRSAGLGSRAMARDYQLVSRFRAALEENFRTNKSLKYYASLLGVSSQRLNAACKARAGRTASEVLYDRIVIEAKRHLLYTEMTVAEIGHAIGYDDPAYFNRFFTQRVGTPPGTFRSNAATTRRIVL